MVSDSDMNRMTDPEPAHRGWSKDPLKLPRVQYPSYFVGWSPEDGAFVAMCDWFPSLSWSERDCVAALRGLTDMLFEHFGEAGLVARREEINRARGYR